MLRFGRESLSLESRVGGLEKLTRPLPVGILLGTYCLEQPRV